MNNSAELTVSAASSLTDVLTETGRAFERVNPDVTVHFSFAASGVLLQQIRQGAPVDVLVSASLRELDTLATEQKIEAKSRVTLTGNRLVLVAPVGSALRRWDELATAAAPRIALANPEFVPAGRYAKETLSRRGLWTAVVPKAVYGQNVRQVLAYVASGDVAAGLVFATDAAREKRVRIVATAQPGKDHEPIVYGAAVIRRSLQSRLARRFIAFLKSPSGQATFAHYGFRPAGR